MSVGVKFPFVDSMRTLHKKLGDVQELAQHWRHKRYGRQPHTITTYHAPLATELGRARRLRSWPELGDHGAGPSQETVEQTWARRRLVDPRASETAERVWARRWPSGPKPRCLSWSELEDGGVDPGLETVEQVRAPRRWCWPETRGSGADRSQETAVLTRVWKRQSESVLGDGRAGKGSDTAEVPGLGDEENERFLMEKCLDSVWALVN